MRKISNAIIALLLGCILISGCSSNNRTNMASDVANISSAENKVMTFESNIALSNEISDPTVNNSIQTIVLSFSEEIESKTMTDVVKLYRIDAKNNPVEVSCVVKVDSNDNTKININTAEMKSFPEGEEYKIEVSQALKSLSGLMLEKDYTGYFATNNNFTFSDSSKINNERTQILIISDIHLGIDDTFAEITRNRQALVEFLIQVKNSSKVKELIIAGDFLDAWFLPMDYQMPDSLADFFIAIAANNQTVVDAFNEIIREGNVKVTYLPGNHDILLTETDMERIFPGINQARDDVQGLGTYITGENSEIAIEHGHKYDIFCSPDAISNRDIISDASSILPVGYFFTRIATSSVMEGLPETNNTFAEMIPNKEDESQLNYYLYYQIWKEALTSLPVTESFSDKVIKTNIAGYIGEYAINDIIPIQSEDKTIDVNLYKGIPDNWAERQAANGVKVTIPAKDSILGALVSAYTDKQAQTQFFDVDSSIKIVVFGHTHFAKILSMTNLENEKTIYANTGTWIDNSSRYPTMTFVVVTPAKADSAIETVNLYQYSEDKSITQWQEAQGLKLGREQ